MSDASILFSRRKSSYASVVMTKPGGTLKPAFRRMPRFEAFPPASGILVLSRFLRSRVRIDDIVKTSFGLCG